MRVVNHAKGERLRKAKEDKKRKRQRKLQAREWGSSPTATMMTMTTMMR